MNKPITELQHPKMLLDPYGAWAAREGVPITEDFGVDLLAVPTAPWARFGVDGGIVHLKGRGDFVSIFVLDLAPGASHRAAEAHVRGGGLRALGARLDHHRDAATAASTASSGGRRACSRSRSTPATGISTRAGASARGSPRPTISPLMLNLFHNESFVFDNDYRVPRAAGRGEVFLRRGRVHPGAARPQHVGDQFRPRPRRLRTQAVGRRAAPAART